MNPLLSLKSRCAKTARQRERTPGNRRRPAVELLEAREVPAVFPNDPEFAQQWLLHNTGQTGGAFDADIDAPEAWAITTGSMATVVAVLDDGVDYKDPDLYLNVWINQGEMPAALAGNLVDVDGDSLITFRDLNTPANAAHVSDLNANGYIDGGDLLNDAQWENGLDEDNNGRADDLVGWDFQDNDNDPMYATTNTHGTDMSKIIGAISDNGVGKAGVNWQVRLMPIRIGWFDGSQTQRNITNAAAGLDYAVAEGASISNNSWGDNTYSSVMYDAIDRARQAGHLFVAAAGNFSQDMDATPFYPAGYDLDNIVSAAATDMFDQKSSASNYGLINVDLGAPSPSGGTSGASAHTSGVAALIKSLHPDWDFSEIRARILATVDPLPALAGKTVTGGRLNAARALATTTVSINDPVIVEGASGSSQLIFTVTRGGDDTGNITLDWSTANGTATAGSDYVAASGQLTFAPSGPNAQTIAIEINSDTIQEADETFLVELTLVSGNAFLADEAGQGTILSDDIPITISDSTALEGDQTAHYRGPFVTGLPSPAHFIEVVFGPDGNLYTAVGTGAGYNTIRRYDGTTGAFIDTFVPQGKINGVRDILFRNEFMYVGSEYTDEVLRFDAATGAFVDVFVTAGSGGINGTHGLTFGPDANADGVPELYASGRDSFSVVRYDGVTGLPLGTYVASGSGGLSWPEGLTFDPTGNFLFVASPGSNNVLKYNALTGAYVGVGASTNLSAPKSVMFDAEGLLYVASAGNDRIIRFTAAAGYVDDYVAAGSGGMDNPHHMAFGPDGDLYVAGTAPSEIMRFGTDQEAVFTVSLASPSSQTVTVQYATANGTAVAGSDYTAVSGTITFAPGQTSRTIFVPTLDDGAVETNETFTLNLSNPVGATITDGQGQATITDDDTSRTISISDASVVEGDTTIRPLGAFVSTPSPYAMIVGPDGKLYVGSYSGTVNRYDAGTGSPLPAPGKAGAEFVSPGSGGLNGMRDIAFGPDDYLYAVSELTDSVLRYDPITGAFAGTLVASGAGGLDAPRGLLFRNGHVYVTSVGADPQAPGSPGTDSVLRYDAATGAPAGLSGLPGDAVFIASGSGGLDNPSRLVFGPDGMVYVCSTATTFYSASANSVLRYDGVTGAPAGVSGQPGNAVFVAPGSGGLDGPVAMVFRPDGYLYVTSWRNNSVFRYQSSTGAFAGVVVPAGAGGLSKLIDLVFEPDGNFLVTSSDTNQVLRYGAGSQAAFTVSLSSPSATPVTVSYATVPGSATAGSDYTATSGTLTFAPGQTSRTIFVPTLDDLIGEPTETFTITLSSPVGATIADGTGVGTILDNETKFFVVNDATTNQTYEYASDGVSVESYALGSGNTAPRGAASTAAGNKVWVVDANKTVYVYNTSGGLLGSWSAGSMNGAAQVEGIATNGADIWLVDNKQDKVFKYTGAASRLSGSQNAASSFNLNNSNKDAQGIVTNGVHLWVVNDSSTDKVFKYTVAGALVGSWTITGGGGAPTGITLDPTSVAHLWIVDNGTDRVYQYDNAATRTSGSQAASLSFALAAGNTNPQDIADPPTGGGTPARAKHQRRKQRSVAPSAGIGIKNDWRSAVDAVFGGATTGKRRQR